MEPAILFEEQGGEVGHAHRSRPGEFDFGGFDRALLPPNREEFVAHHQMADGARSFGPDRGEHRAIGRIARIRIERVLKGAEHPQQVGLGCQNTGGDNRPTDRLRVVDEVLAGQKPFAVERQSARLLDPCPMFQAKPFSSLIQNIRGAGAKPTDDNVQRHLGMTRPHDVISFPKP